MVTLVYRAQDVGPVCRNIAAQGEGLQALHEGQLRSPHKGTIIRWGSRWNGRATVEVNSADAVGLARDKRASRRHLGDLGPRTWFRLVDVQLPCVIRPKRHHAGQHFYVCRSMNEVQRATARCRLGWYASELIDKVREFRVFVLYGYVVGVSERFPRAGQANKAIAWNLSQGGRTAVVKRGEWPIPVVLTAIKAASIIGLDWSAVDLALDRGGRPIVFEVNTAPGISAPYRVRGIAKAFAWLNDNPSTRNENPRGNSWKDLLHPALRH